LGDFAGFSNVTPASVFIGGIAISILLSFAPFGQKNTLQYQKQYQKKVVYRYRCRPARKEGIRGAIS
jgi:hypothetical protein